MEATSSHIWVPLTRTSAAGETIRQTLAKIPPPTNPAELWEYVRLITGVRLARRRICPDHAAPFDAFATAYFAREVRDGAFVKGEDNEPASMCIWKASRGFGGKSFMLALLTHVESVAMGADTAVLGGSGEQSKRVTGYHANFWAYDHSPHNLLRGTPGGLRTRLLNGGATLCLMASQASVRGSHQPRLRLDEADVMKQSILDSALGQTMRQDGVDAQTCISSTHQNALGTMTEMLRRAVERGWPVFEWCYRESMGVAGTWFRDARNRWRLNLRGPVTGWLSLREVERKRNEVTEAMWMTEYDLQEPNPEGRAFNSEAVDRMFDGERWGYAAPRDGDELVIEEPVQGGIYATGVDWAKTRDWTIIVTYRIDVKPWRVVAYMKVGRQPWPTMIGYVNDRMARYGGTLAHDATGLGGVINDYLEADCQWIPFIMAGRARADMLSNFIAFVEADGVVSQQIPWAYSEHKYASYQQVFQPDQQNHTPDTIVAFALAHHAATSGGGEWQADPEIDEMLEDMSDIERAEFGEPLVRSW